MAGSRTFNGAGDEVQFALGSGPTTAYTLAVVMKPVDLGVGHSGGIVLEERSTNEFYQYFTDAANTQDISSQSTDAFGTTATQPIDRTWNTTIVGKTAGTNRPRFSRINLSTGIAAHEDGNTTLLNWASATGWRVGRYPSNEAALDYSGQVAAIGIWTRNLTDVERATLRTYGAFVALTPNILWRFDGSVATPIADGSGGAATQSSITGTTHSTDEPTGFWGSNSYTVTLADTVTGAESAVRKITALRTRTETTTLAESNIRHISNVRTRTDSATITEAYSGSRTFRRIGVESVLISDTALRTASYARLILDLNHVAEALTRTINIQRILSDTIHTTDVGLGSKLIIRAISDAIGVVESSPIRTVRYGRNLVDSLTALEGITRIISAIRSSSDAIAYTETLSRSYRLPRSIVDNVAFVDTSAFQKLSIKSLVESVTINSSVVTENLKNIISTEAVSLSESLRREIGYDRLSLDNINISERIAEIISRAISLSDLATFVESLIGLRLRFFDLTETIHLSEISTHRDSVARHILDDVHTSNSVRGAGIFHRIPNDAIRISDVIHRSSQTHRSVSQTVNVIDALHRYARWIRRGTEGVHVADSQHAARTYRLRILDRIHAVDSDRRQIIRRYHITELLHIDEFAHRERTQARALTDLSHITDSVARPYRVLVRHLTDTFRLEDVTLRQGAYHRHDLQDTLTLLESLHNNRIERMINNKIILSPRITDEYVTIEDDDGSPQTLVIERTRFRRTTMRRVIQPTPETKNKIIEIPRQQVVVASSTSGLTLSIKDIPSTYGLQSRDLLLAVPTLSKISD